MIRARLCRKRVLLVLDDVDHHSQLEFLANSHEWFGPGSRIVITTRDEQMLWDTNAKYKPDLLKEDQALELFCRHAFKKLTPLEGYEELSCRAIHYVGYLPLAVKVLGSFFRGRDARVWRSAFNGFDKEPNKEIFEILEISFDGLTDFEKKIFLDIACFFKGEAIDRAKILLDSFGFEPDIGISVLVEKSFITVLDGQIDMHDLIQEMGWQIVRKSFPNSRIWKLEQINDIIKRNEKLEEIEAIVMSYNQYDVDRYEENVCINAHVFERMKNLRMVDIIGKFTSCEPTFLPDDLKWLRWKWYPFSSLPIAGMRKLVGLEVLGGTIAQFWIGQQKMKNMKYMNLEELDCLTMFPDVSNAPNIETLSLSRCKNLVEVHESLGSCKRLIKLEMMGCERLKYLPTRIEMDSLEVLSLENYYSLQIFPDVSGAPNMYWLSLNGCKNLVEVHESLGSHKSLEMLNMVGCEQLKYFPSTIDMDCLKILNLSNCLRLERFPYVSPRMDELSYVYADCFSNTETSSNFISVRWVLMNRENSFCSCKKPKKLKKLGSMEDMKILRHEDGFEAFKRVLDLKSLTNVRSLKVLDLHGRQMEDEDFPKDLHSLSSLEYLNLSGNNKLIQLPASISHLSGLIMLFLNSCNQLQNLDGLPSNIWDLEANYCSSLENIKALSTSCGRLHKASLLNCEKLLEDQENERYVRKIFESFPKRCDADVVNDDLDLVIPGKMIPRWFEEEADGCCKVTLKIPSKNKNQIIGIAICAVFALPLAMDKYEKEGELFGKKELSRIDAYAPSENGNVVSIHYERFQKRLPLVVSTPYVAPWIHHIDEEIPAIRCGARLVYKEEVESDMPLKVYSRRNHKRTQEHNQQDSRKQPRLEMP